MKFYNLISEDLCPTTGSSYHPDSDSCTKYYLCNDGKYSKFECTNGLYFNFATASCDIPKYVKCLPEEEIPEGSNDKLNVMVTFIMVFYFADPLCPGNDIKYRSSENDCSKFITCRNGIDEEVECIEGFYFNPNTQKCDYAENVECKRKYKLSHLQQSMLLHRK